MTRPSAGTPMSLGIPAILLGLGLLINMLVLAGPIWDEAKALDQGQDFASYYYAVGAAAQGLDPYDRRQLGTLAKEDGARKSVFPFLYPPPFLLTMTWSLPMSLQSAYLTWFWLNGLFLLAALLALWRWLPEPATMAAIGIVLATFTPIYDNQLMGQANLPVLAAMLWGLYLVERRHPVSGGALMGLASMMKMSPALMVAWWMYRRNWTAVLSASAAAALLSLAALPLVGWDAQLRFYRDVLPGFARGDYNGLFISILHPGNHSLPNLWAQLFDAERRLTGLAQILAAATTLGLLGLLAWKLRRQAPDLLGAAAAAAAVSVMMLLIPVYAYEHHLVQMIFPLVVTSVALARGRLGRGWILALAPAYTVLAWWWPAIAAASRSVGGPTGWLLQEAKFFAMVTVCLACAFAATQQDRATSEPRLPEDSSERP